MKAINFVAKYSANNKSKAVVPYDKVKATEKWVEYSLDVADMSRILMTVDFDTKWRLMEALAVAERKKEYMYRHKNFDIKRALKIFDTVKHLPKTK
jgi:phosphoserine aminotransferase